MRNTGGKISNLEITMIEPPYLSITMYEVLFKIIHVPDFVIEVAKDLN